MVRFIVCDDDVNLCKRIHNMITKIMMPYEYDYKVDEFLMYDKELQKIIDLKTEQKIYILDIEMGKVSGLEIASMIRENDWDNIIVFLTSHSECQDDIFYSRLLAFDYINKDVLYEKRLAKTLKFALKILDSKKVLAFTSSNVTHRIPYSDVLYIERIPGTKKCLIVTESGDDAEITSTITELEKKLKPMFYRSHKSAIVNVTKIKQVDCNLNEVTFNDGTITNNVSDRQKKELKEYVIQYNK